VSGCDFEFEHAVENVTSQAISSHTVRALYVIGVEVECLASSGPT
jgi:hypothetical protein